jgi:hypothetical protein
VRGGAGRGAGPKPQPWDNREELIELVELQKCLDEVEVARVAKAGQLAFLMEDISMVLVDLGLPLPQGSTRTYVGLVMS